jgi:choline dehydrogenase-like flavoprotein
VWIYPKAYHIKVAVRDDDTFWLSSGNWINSNRPEMDLSDPASARQIAAKSDRDWHVIVSSPSLSRTFREFLQHDFDVASAEIAKAAAQAAMTDAAALRELDVQVAPELFAMGKAPRQFFEPRTLNNTIRIQPLLTPDNYKGHVKTLIESAQTAFYMQTQYIHPSDKNGDQV